MNAQQLERTGYDSFFYILAYTSLIVWRERLGRRLDAARGRLDRETPLGSRPV